MLSRGHGASTLANAVRKSSESAITCTKGIPYLQKDTMRSAIASLTRRPATSSSSPVPHSTDTRFWQPQNGIVFDSSSIPRKMSSLHSSSTATTADVNEQELLQFKSEDFYALGTPLDAGAKSVEAKEVKKLERIVSTDAKSRRIDTVAAKTSDVDLDHISFSFQLSSKLFEEAKNAEPGTPESYWSHKLYRRPAKDGSTKTDEERVTVHYCKSKETTERVMQYFTNDKVIGFDIEWSVPLKHGAKNNVSLIQIANDERVALFHIALFAKNEIDDLVAPTLKKVMEDPNITKVGVAIRGDCTRLRKHLNIDCKGLFELSHLYKLVRYSSTAETALINKKLVSLQTQVEEHLKLPMFKGQEVRSSDWSKALKMDQIMYAASDSYAGLRLFETLEEQRKQLDPTPPRPHHAELMLPIRLADGITIETTEDQTEEPDTDPTSPKTTTTPLTPTPKEKLPPKEKAPPSPQALEADIWVSKWKSSLPRVHKIKASNRQLQAYNLWHIQKYSISEVAALLRENPLAESTVRNYVLEAVNLECLEFDKARMREVVGAVGELAGGRYKRIVGQLGL